MGVANLWTESVSCCGHTNKNRESSHIVELKLQPHKSQNTEKIKKLTATPKAWVAGGGCNIGERGEDNIHFGGFTQPMVLTHSSKLCSSVELADEQESDKS